MPAMQYEPIPSDDESAAAIAAVRCYVEQRATDDYAGQSEDVAPSMRAWSAAAALAAQGLPPTRGGTHRSWGTAERAARIGRWSYGIISI
jgi:hypothetical protein